jgi:nucleotide-binding universal stress UspA family protein
METILLPTDFSPTAKNAALYALKLAEQLNVKKLVLYHSYEIPVTIDPLVPGIQMLDIESLKTGGEEGVRGFALQLKDFAGDIIIDTINEYGSLADGLDEVCIRTNAGLVVMGISGGGILEEKLIGSNTLSVAKHTKVPVIIVPAQASFTRIESVMLASDFDKSDKTVPIEPIRKIVEETKAKLLVFHLEENEEENAVTYSTSPEGASYALYTLLQDLSPEYHFEKNKDFVEAINEFALEKGVDLIITIPKKHGFFEGLFTTSHTKALAFHSHVPLMVVHT